MSSLILIFIFLFPSSISAFLFQWPPDKKEKKDKRKKKEHRRVIINLVSSHMPNRPIKIPIDIKFQTSIPKLQHKHPFIPVAQRFFFFLTICTCFLSVAGSLPCIFNGITEFIINYQSEIKSKKKNLITVNLHTQITTLLFSSHMQLTRPPLYLFLIRQVRRL